MNEPQKPPVFDRLLSFHIGMMAAGTDEFIDCDVQIAACAKVLKDAAGIESFNILYQTGVAGEAREDGFQIQIVLADETEIPEREFAHVVSRKLAKACQQSAVLWTCVPMLSGLAYAVEEEPPVPLAESNPRLLAADGGLLPVVH